MAAAPDAALILAGFGTSSPLQLTTEAQQLAAHVGHVLALGLPDRLRSLFVRNGVEIADLDRMMDGSDFAHCYAQVAQAVLQRAEHQPPAMFVSQGSPLFLNAITRFLVAEARKRDLTVRILPGVSPVDVAVAELGIDVGRSGLQALSAAGFIARSNVVSPRMPLLLLELAGVPGREGSLEAYGSLVGALSEFYPENQPVTLLNTAGPGGSSLLTVTLERFSELLPHIDTSSSIFIDVRRKARAVPAQSRPRTDQQAESPA